MCLYVTYGWFSTTVLELSTWDRDHKTYKAENIYCLTLYQKCSDRCSELCKMKDWVKWSLMSFLPEIPVTSQTKFLKGIWHHSKNMVLCSGSYLKECVSESPNQNPRHSLELLLMCVMYLLTSESPHYSQNIPMLTESKKIYERWTWGKYWVQSMALIYAAEWSRLDGVDHRESPG